MSDSPAPIFVNASFTVLGGTLQRATRVPLKYVDNGDGMKIPMLGVRKRDYWMFGPFLPNKMTEAIRDAVAAAIKNLQARFRIVVMEKRKERLQVELDKEVEELEAADAGRKDLGISDDESDDESALPTEAEEDSDDDAFKTPGRSRPSSSSTASSGVKPKRSFTKGPIILTKILVGGKEFEVVENGHLRGINIRATEQSIKDIITLFHIEYANVTGRTSGMPFEAEGQGSKPDKLSWKQKQAALANPKATAAEEDDADEDEGAFSIKGLVGWRNSDKSFMIWYKKADGMRTQTQKGLTVKTTKKVGGVETPLKRKEFLGEKRKTFQAAIKMWNESDCSKRPRIATPENK